MKEQPPFKKYLLFIICSVLVIASAAFYFCTSADKNEKTIIIINKDEQRSIEVTAKVNTAKKQTQKTTKTTVKTTTIKITETQPIEKIYIDINSANIDELQKLNGIGEILAEKIVNYRNNNGSFKNIEEIMSVSGIGEGIFNQIKENIYVIDPIYEIYEETDTVIEENNEQEIQTFTEVETEEALLTLEEVIPVNINTAEAEYLILLPHVDEEIAGNIIEFRQKAGKFQNEYELILIEGLSQNQVAEIIPYITTE